MWLSLLVLAYGCADDDPAPPSSPAPAPAPVPVPVPEPSTPTEPLTVITGPTVELPESRRVRLVRELHVAASRPVSATVELWGAGQGRRITFPTVASEHVLPLLGLLPDSDYEVVVTLNAEDGASVEATPVAFHVDALDVLVPVLEVVSGDADAAEPRYTLMGLEADDAGFEMILVADLQGRPVWLFDPGGGVKAVSLGADGILAGLFDGELRRLDPVGVWGTTVSLPDTEFHHEAELQPDGSFFGLTKSVRPVTDYPIDEDDPTLTADVEISDDHVVHVAPDGTVLLDWSMADRLDERRIGYGSANSGASGAMDWAHANAAVALPAEGAVLVSLRHQDALVKLDQATGDVIWILANPDGWPPELQPYLLAPVGDPFAWQYHQHAPMVLGDRIVVFDNGNFRRTTPYSQDPEDEIYSRLVEFEVDEASRTVRQVWAHTVGDPPLYSAALGNADILPLTGHVLATFAFLTAEDGVINFQLGRGKKSVRVIEVDPSTDSTVWDLRVYGLEADVPNGWQCDRATRVPSLYGDRATEVWLQD